MEKVISQHPLSLREPERGYALIIINRLYEIKRTGWVDRGVEDPETVGEHTDQLLLIAKQNFPQIKGLDIMLKIHDWPEAGEKVGDRRVDTFCPDDHRITKQEKRILEVEAMSNICAKLGKYGKTIMDLWLEFEEAKTERAKIAYQIDKLQAILKAIEYEEDGQPVIAQEFIAYQGHTIENPILKEILIKAIS